MKRVTFACVLLGFALSVVVWFVWSEGEGERVSGGTVDNLEAAPAGLAAEAPSARIRVEGMDGHAVDTGWVSYVGLQSGDGTLDERGERELSPGDYEVLVRVPGYEPRFAQVKVRTGEVSSVQVQRYGSVRVHVHDEMGNPVADKRVWLIPPFVAQSLHKLHEVPGVRDKLLEAQAWVLEQQSLSFHWEEMLTLTDVLGDPEAFPSIEWVLVTSAIDIGVTTTVAGIASFAQVPAGCGYRFCVLDEPLAAVEPENLAKTDRYDAELDRVVFRPSQAWQTQTSGGFDVRSGECRECSATVARETWIEGEIPFLGGEFVYGFARSYEVVTAGSGEILDPRATGSLRVDGSFRLPATPGVRDVHVQVALQTAGTMHYWFFSERLNCLPGVNGLGLLQPMKNGPAVSGHARFVDTTGAAVTFESIVATGPKTIPLAVNRFRGVRALLDLDLDMPFVLHGLGPQTNFVGRVNPEWLLHDGRQVTNPQPVSWQEGRTIALEYLATEVRYLDLTWAACDAAISVYVRRVNGQGLAARSRLVSEGPPASYRCRLRVSPGEFELLAYRDTTEGQSQVQRVTVSTIAGDTEHHVELERGARLQFRVREESGAPAVQRRVALSVAGWFGKDRREAMYWTKTNEHGEAEISGLPAFTELLVHGESGEVVRTGAAGSVEIVDVVVP